jgi:hypothetical protein
MKRLIPFLLLALSIRAGDALPPAPVILEAARAQLPSHPVELSGTLKERTANGFVRTSIRITIQLDWGAAPPRATYRLQNEKSEALQTLEIEWLPDEPLFRHSENGIVSEAFDPHKSIDGLGITWADLSFAFLWQNDAQTIGTERKLGRNCFLLTVPRPGENRLKIWIEQETGRMLGAREETAGGKLVKDIKVVSVKEFDGLWMVKDLDMIRPQGKRRTSLRIDEVTSLQP